MIARYLLLLMGVVLPAWAATPASPPTFTLEEFAQLKFLVGRWQGKAPDGSTFHEEYDFPDSHTLRSRRFPDASFTMSNDSSTVTWREGVVKSHWGKYSWRAIEITADRASFAPENAPSSFSWRRVSADAVEVTQRWKDEAGKEQTYTVPLKRAVSPQ